MLHILFSEHHVIQTAHISYCNSTGSQLTISEWIKEKNCLNVLQCNHRFCSLLSFWAVTVLPTLSAIHETHTCSNSRCFNCKTVPVDMPNPVWKHFGYSQLWPSWQVYSQNRAGSYIPDPTSRIQFNSIFPKKVWIILYTTDPELI